jgi:hypothetical protein
LTIDQNRSTVVDRIVGEWGDRLAASNAGINSAQLREILSGLRADHLLAASLAGNVEGLRNVVAGALVHADAAISPALMHTKALGDTGDDLVYIPIVPCRILDTRHGTTPPYNAQMVGGSAFPVAGNLANFAPQGGSATSCGLPSSFAAIAVTLTVLNPNFDAFLAASSSSDFPTLTQSVVMDFSANRGLANTAIVPVDGTVKFYLGLPAQVTTQVIADAVGYLRRPTNYGGTHTITGVDATDSGGFNNTASGNYSTVAGGSGNIASGGASVVAGGDLSTASGGYSTVAGGTRNTASGDFYSTVAGGAFNTASGQLSFAAGHNVLADISGCAVFGFFSSGPANCKGVGNIIRVMGEHGFTVDWGLPTGNGGGQYWVEINDLTPGRPINTYTNAYLSAGGAWVNNSDRNKKEHFASVDAQSVLAKVVALPVTQWSYKAEPGVLRMGPVAQDFHTAFGLGAEDLTIAPTDEGGVALAAIQGLHQMMKQRDREIAQLKRKLQALEAKLGL